MRGRRLCLAKTARILPSADKGREWENETIRQAFAPPNAQVSARTTRTRCFRTSLYVHIPDGNILSGPRITPANRASRLAFLPSLGTPSIPRSPRRLHASDALRHYSHATSDAVPPRKVTISQNTATRDSQVSRVSTAETAWEGTRQRQHEPPRRACIIRPDD